MNARQFGLSQATKAWLAGPAAMLSYVAGMSTAADLRPWETIGTMTTGQWAGLLLAGLLGYGVTWTGHNSPPPEAD